MSGDDDKRTFFQVDIDFLRGWVLIDGRVGFVQFFHDFDCHLTVRMVRRISSSTDTPVVREGFQVPHIVLLLLISYALGKGEKGVIVGVALTHWPNLARVIRGEILQVREAAYVGIAKQLGKSPWYIARWHIFPQILPQFLVGLVLLFPHAILHEASITFLGFGLPPEKPAIGVILSESMSYLSTGKWWLALFPGLALVGVVILFDRIGSGLKALLDPSSAQL